MEFEELLKELELNLSKLKKNDLTLNDTLKLYEESMEKIIQAKEVLNKAELRFKELSVNKEEN